MIIVYCVLLMIFLSLILGDLMGPSMDGLDKLLAMPYGCGEQNMLKFAPNIYVMDYLTATKQVTPEVEEKSKRFMTSGSTMSHDCTPKLMVFQPSFDTLAAM